MKKPVSSRPINCFGSTILTNLGFLEEMCKRRQQTRVVAEALEKSKADSKILRSIRHAQSIVHKEEVEAKRIALVYKRQCNAQIVYQLYKNDVANSIREPEGDKEDLIESWVSSKVELIKCAFVMFCDYAALRQQDASVMQTKNKMILHLRKAFELGPYDLKVFEENGQANEEL